MSFLMTLAGYYSAKSALSLPNNDAMLPSAGATLMIGFGKEIADDLSPTNIFSLKDLFADILGILSAILILSIIHP
ncbi:MAG: hypothetical protein SFU91_12710 [Chloroherpetonaceae bacterium]|nr:hypothetical protein [Chloroherpetonaceae bacterium]